LLDDRPPEVRPSVHGESEPRASVEEVSRGMTQMMRWQRQGRNCLASWVTVLLAFSPVNAERRDGSELHLDLPRRHAQGPTALLQAAAARDASVHTNQNGSIAYSALHERTQAFLKASRNYQVQVKGRLMDSTDVYLQRKERYEHLMHNLDKGERKQHRLIHLMRESLKKQHQQHMKEFQSTLDADPDTLIRGNGEDEDEDDDEDEDEEDAVSTTAAAEGHEDSASKEGEGSSKVEEEPTEAAVRKAEALTNEDCKFRKGAEKGTAIWCGCNTNGEVIAAKETCEDQGGGRADECQWSAEESTCLPKK